MSVIVVDYNAGNLTSVMNALSRIGVDAKSSRDADEIARATRLVFPGVGAAASAMETLTRTGIGDAIKTVVKAGNPVLGICIGCQIILEESEEDGGVKTLGLIPGRAVRFKDEPGLKIPHMGWNSLTNCKGTKLFDGLDNQFVYFVHSYHLVTENKNYKQIMTNYGYDFCSAIEYNNIYATQFHPEKSGDVGLTILKRFATLV